MSEPQVGSIDDPTSSQAASALAVHEKKWTPAQLAVLRDIYAALLDEVKARPREGRGGGGPPTNPKAASL